MATYVLVHGGGHGGWCYQPVARLLRSHGHEVFTPTLTGLGERRHLLSPAVDLDMHITDVVNTLEFEDLHAVILAGHSYGGTVITGVADRAMDRIGHLVYLDAPIPQDGRSLVDVVGPAMASSRDHGRVVDGVELVMWPSADPRSFHGVTDPDRMAWMAPRLAPHPWKCFEQKLHLPNAAAIAKIPQTYIVCSERMRIMARQAFANAEDARLWEIESGHDLMIIKPEALTEMLLRLA